MPQRQQNLFGPAPEAWEVDEAADRLVATVVFPEAPYGPFDYSAPEHLRGEVEPGRRVRVPLGRGNRTVVGYCVGLMGSADRQRRQQWPGPLKEVKSVLDTRPLVSPSMLRLTEWMADYYLCPWGQVLEAVVPAGVRGQAGTRRVTYLSVPTGVAAKLANLKLPPKQAEVLQLLAASPQPLAASELAAAAKCSMAPIKELQRKGLLRGEVQRVHQLNRVEPPQKREDRPALKPEQQTALDCILDALYSRRQQTILVHGVTGSGKTEVYMRAIEEVVSFGRQAIALVPEISLTPQTVARFRCRFDRVAVLHSHLSAAERHWHWRKIAAGEVPVVVGARSAVFAPAPHLGLIVLDEEHDASFKQDTAPRYHARDVALERARREGVPVVLGSATPSLESWHRARAGDYRLVELPGRVFGQPLPDVGVIDLRVEFRSRYTRGAISRPLHQAIGQALREEGQVILLLNRRGFSTTIQCPACGLVVRCPNCDIALTHHRQVEKAICHYCDYQIDTPPACPGCRFEGIRYGGLGTQRLEAEVRARFSGARCLRMDSDAMQKPGSHEQALARFRAGEVDILLGTQMIAKGLDFPNVTLVGVVNADTALHFPDFRAAEKTFQLVTQVAGRTGRGPRGGRVLVQTFSPEHPAIVAATRHDFTSFAEQELPVRAQYGYPPLGSMIRLVVRGSDEQGAEQFAEQVGGQLRSEISARGLNASVLGPAPAPLAKLRGKFRFHILLQGSPGEHLHSAARDVTSGLKPPEEVQWIVDVDPLDML